MTGVEFTVTGMRADPSALAPTLQLGLRITAPPDRQVQSILLHCQLRIEPERRRYELEEQAGLLDVFGAPHRWAETLMPFLLTHVTTPVPGFTGTLDTEVPVALSYDLDVAAGKYLQALGDGTVPLLVLFSGSVFYRATAGMQVEQIPWDREARHDLPVAVWRAAIDAHHPGTGWLRLQHDTIAALQRYKAEHALATWDDVVADLLGAAAGGHAGTEAGRRVRALGNGDGHAGGDINGTGEAGR